MCFFVSMRLDNYLVNINIFDSRTKAKQAILRGEILVDGEVVDKPAYFVSSDVKIEHVYSEKFVSLGGYKLSKAVKDFDFSVKDSVCADIGASTGGFTDCLLKCGAKKVYAVDLNDELLHKDLKNNCNVVPLIKNARELAKNDFNEELDLVVADLSFISATMVMDVFSKLLNKGKCLILLIKPQFEVGGKRKFKNGIIKDDAFQKAACEKVIDCAVGCGFKKINVTTAPIVDGKNLEYLALFEKIT